MKGKNKLFELIRSMRKAEKVYFKRYTSMHVKGRQNNYTGLFDAFARLEEYDEKKIRKTLRNNPALKFFSSSQNYLYRLILKSLRAYHSGESAFTKTTELVLDFYILRDLGLIEQSHNTLENIKKLALETEDLPLMLKAGFLQENNAFRKPDIKAFTFMEKEVYPLMSGQLEKIKEGIEIGKLRNKAHFLYLKYGENTPDESVVKEIRLMLKDPLFVSGRGYFTRDNLYSALGAKSILHFILGDYISMKNINQSHLDALKKDPFFNTETILSSYGLLLANRISICHRLGNAQEATFVFNKIRSLKIKSVQREIAIFMYAYINILGMYGDFGMIDKSLSLIPEIAKKLKIYGDKISGEGRMIFYLNISSIYFLEEDYKSSLKWITRALNISDKDIRMDVQVDIKFFNVLVHYELANFQLVESLVISLRRFLIKQKQYTAFAKMFLENIKRLAYLRDKTELRSVFEIFKNNLENMTKDNTTRSYVFTWIKKKLQD